MLREVEQLNNIPFPKEINCCIICDARRIEFHLKQSRTNAIPLLFYICFLCEIELRDQVIPVRNWIEYCGKVTQYAATSEVAKTGFRIPAHKYKSRCTGCTPKTG